MMGAPKKGRTMYPRQGPGEGVMAVMRLSITDEGVYFVRLAWKEITGPTTTWVQYGERKLWDPDYSVEAFARHIGGAVMDVVEWTVS